jgi:putative pyruvate formate lyase activating enzyme
LRNSLQALRLIAKHVSTTVPVSIMSQYTPIPAVANDPLLGQRTTKEEYEAVVEYALDLGLETIFSQDVDERSLAPDFDKEKPFAF